MIDILVSALVSASLVFQAASPAPAVQTLRKSQEAVQFSARQVKTKANGDPSKLEQQYGAMVALAEKWRGAAVSGATTDALSEELGRAMATFGKDARSYLSGQQVPLVGKSVNRFQDELKEAAKAISRAAAADRPSLATALVWEPWSALK